MNLHLATQTSIAGDKMPQMSMLYKVATGTVKERGYGIALARAIGLPEDLVNDAERISKGLSEKRQAKQQNSEYSKVLRRRKLVLNLQETLRHVVESDMDEKAFKSFLIRLRAEFITKMSAIDREDVEMSPIETFQQSSEQQVPAEDIEDGDIEVENDWDIYSS
jgi:DNA mismatch repair protein MSH4